MSRNRRRISTEKRATDREIKRGQEFHDPIGKLASSHGIAFGGKGHPRWIAITPNVCCRSQSAPKTGGHIASAMLRDCQIESDGC